MRNEKKHPQGHLAEECKEWYYHALLKLERNKKNFILRYLRKHQPDAFASLEKAIADDVERNYRRTMKQIGDIFMAK